MSLKIKLHSDDAVLPIKAGPQEVGYDLTAISKVKTIGQMTMYDTGISVEPPEGFFSQIVPRSSIVKSGYILSNSVGVIVPTYTGTLKICLTKIDPMAESLELPFTLCQLVFHKSYHFPIEVVSELTGTSRGDGAFGSTDQSSLENNKLTEQAAEVEEGRMFQRSLRFGRDDMWRERMLRQREQRRGMFLGSEALNGTHVSG
jgi:deoxyuridine 5'-triphosphate nucleotidohydrolase